jgi:hypothetical protein
LNFPKGDYALIFFDYTLLITFVLEDPKDFARQYPDLVQAEEHENDGVSNGLNFRLFNDGFKYEFKARRAAQFPAKVMPFVFLGNVETARDCELLKKSGFFRL